MRRSPLKRTALPPGVTPLKRGAELKRNKGIARSKAAHPGNSLAPRSKATAKLYRLERVPAVRESIEANRPCEVGEILGRAGFGPDGYRCHGLPRRGHDGWGFHHRRKASAGGSDRIGPNALWCCAACNGAIEDYPRSVRELTGTALVVREGDPEWTSLGRRADHPPAS